jgi:hypothetical protein
MYGFCPIQLSSEINEIITVQSSDAMETARLLAKKEGILAGVSSGAARGGGGGGGAAPGVVGRGGVPYKAPPPPRVELAQRHRRAYSFNG